jgi:RNA polymerase sigma-70 factor (ECF subfamily)
VNTSDAALIRALQRDDPRAMASVIDVHGGAVYGFLRRTLRRDAAVDDLFQDVFLQLARHADRLDPGTNLHAWLMVVTANRWRSWARWRAVDPTRWFVLDVHDDARADAIVDEISPEQSLDERQQLLRVERALGGLSEADRAVVLLHLDDGLTNAERAAALGISETTWRKRLERARARLSERLSKETP